ncbi:MAG: hypothetical protein ABIB71_03450 [Candidatus Woesearchaeota archaeon]
MKKKIGLLALTAALSLGLNSCSSCARFAIDTIGDTVESKTTVYKECRFGFVAIPKDEESPLVGVYINIGEEKVCMVSLKEESEPVVISDQDCNGTIEQITKDGRNQPLTPENLFKAKPLLDMGYLKLGMLSHLKDWKAKYEK